jgi:hypothetical protein
VTTSTRGGVVPERRKGGNDTCWADANLIGSKNKENSRGRFSCYKLTVTI